MMKTSPLKVVFSQSLPFGIFILHPNEGAELGMITKKHQVLLSTRITVQDFLKGGEGEPLTVLMDLQNECPKGELHLNVSYGDLVGESPRAVILFDGSRAFLHPI
jgi:hypothetical protein